jgi:hypothetical protein
VENKARVSAFVAKFCSADINIHGVFQAKFLENARG